MVAFMSAPLYIWVHRQLNTKLASCSTQTVNVPSLVTSQAINQLEKMPRLCCCYQTIFAPFRLSTTFLIIGIVGSQMLSRLITSSPSMLQSAFISKKHMRCVCLAILHWNENARRLRQCPEGVADRNKDNSNRTRERARYWTKAPTYRFRHEMIDSVFGMM